MSEASAIVAEAESRLRPLFVEASLAGWEVNVAATEENEQRRVAADVALSDALADRGLFAAVTRARENGAGPLERRQLDLLHAGMLRSQGPDDLRHRLIELEASVEARFVKHRAEVRGERLTENDVARILRRSDDVAERRDAWEAAKTVGAAVADDVRDLARLRNEIARSLGQRDWFALSVATSEMDEGKLLATLDACDAATAEPFARWKAATDAELAARFGCDVADLRPWHYADPFFQEVPGAGGVDLDPCFAGKDVVELARRTFGDIGLPTEAILERSDLYPREGKCQHAFCIDVDRAGDVRVLANVADDAYWADTMLHELGHGAYDLGFDPALPWLLRDCHLVVTEGIAIMMGALTHDEAWLRDVAGADVGAVGSRLRRAGAAERLLFTRWVLVMTGFERSLYADPDGDHDAHWWELVSRYQLVTPPDGRRAPDWASKIHVACAPVYYHTYLYGQLVAAQLRATLARDVGGLVARPEAGALLTERVFRHGESRRWDDLLEQATGEPLSVRHFAADLLA